MLPKPIIGGNFFTALETVLGSSSGRGHFNDGDLQYAALKLPAAMLIVRRTAEELFSATVAREQASSKLFAVINGNMWNVTTAGKLNAFSGHDPVPAGETTPMGQVIVSGQMVDGTPEPNRFFALFGSFFNSPPRTTESMYEFDKGNPSSLAMSAVGGLGPLILKRLKFGHQNLYDPKVPPGAPVQGEPGPAHLPFLVQRNNMTYIAMAARGLRTGKVAMAIHRASSILLLLVQPDGAPTGISLDMLRDKLFDVGVDDAVFLDGSDSAMLVVNGVFHVSQGEDKDELTTIGLGFR
ncbi:MAG: phosphodiester glycosidase family protein [Hyalangium sp.]|uniref:phosphodiester glycosidase family protein n=1 Tax=Hyalangium sp. TaxID=2028555 RepID=UPI00389B02FB